MFDEGELQDGWSRTTLAGLVAAGGIQGGPFGTQLHASDYVEDGVPITMPKVIGTNGFTEGPFDRVSQEDVERLSTHILQLGDIVVGRKGDLSRRALVRQPNVGWFCGTDCLRIRPDQALADPEWLSYWFGLPEVHDWLHRFATGSTMPNLNTGVLSEVPVLVPPLPEQRAIAEVLGALDDKIESNRRIVSRLQALSSALMESLIPKPWVVRLADLDAVSTQNFSSIGSDIYPLVKPGLTGDVERVRKYIATADVSGSDVTGCEIGITAELPSRANMQPGSDRIWFAKMKGERKVLWTMTEDDEYWNPYILSTGFAGVQPASNYGAIAYTAVLTQEFDEIKESLSTGTTMQAVNNQSLSLMGIVAPESVPAAEVETLMRPLYRRSMAARLEYEHLAEIRDALLPALLSGRIRVPVAAELVEAS